MTGRRGRRRKQLLDDLEEWRGNWIGHILRGNCFLKHVTEEKVRGSDGKARKET